MPAYRLFSTDGAGHIRATNVVEASSDREARLLAKEALKGAPGELWLEAKMVCRFVPGEQPK